MSKNLKARLTYLRNSKREGSNGNNKSCTDGDKNISSPAATDANELTPDAGDFALDTAWPGWIEVGFKTLKRELLLTVPYSLPAVLSDAFAMLVPDFARIGHIPKASSLLFFDLETTGLSGGAGNIAFLAAFGRFATVEKNTAAAEASLVITQYLLLDYSGESDFIELIVKEFTPTDDGLPVVVSYNGKCFDSQILANRCIMKGAVVPEYFHVDLLHPSRRLWKQELPNCSQATIEVSVLGLDRSGDVSGAMAPDIWFSFLRNGEKQDLLKICEHNKKDIAGLASLFLALGEIAVNPIGSQNKYHYDLEALALTWRAALKKYASFVSGREPENVKLRQTFAETAKILLETAALKGCPRAAIVAAMDAEWKLRNPALALTYVRAALEKPGISEGLQFDLEKRRTRLEKKMEG